MAAYNQKLAQEILVALEDKFPQPIHSSALKSSTAQFQSAPDQEWQLALEALLAMNYVEGHPIHVAGSTLASLFDCRITSIGRKVLVAERTWKSFYLEWLYYFGQEFFIKRKEKLLSALVGGGVLFLAAYNTESWMNWKHAFVGVILGVAAGTLWDFVRVPWVMHHTNRPERLALFSTAVRRQRKWE